MKYWYRFLAILAEHEPVFCGCCGKLVFYKDTVMKLTLTRRWVKVCESCISEYFLEDK